MSVVCLGSIFSVERVLRSIKEPVCGRFFFSKHYLRPSFAILISPADAKVAHDYKVNPMNINSFSSTFQKHRHV